MGVGCDGWALEAAYADVVTDDLPGWYQDPGLLNWLAALRTSTPREDYVQRSTLSHVLTWPDRPTLRIIQHCS